MDDRFNTIAGWTLFSGIVALGLSSLSAHIFNADKTNRPEKMGYAIAGVVSSSGAAAAVPIEALLAHADAAKGEDVFKKCASCHTITQGGPNGIGPNLYGVLGDSIGTGRGGFAFSDALKAHGGKWDFKEINKWLMNPRADVDGTKMTFAGLDDPQDRANVIAYLDKQGSNIPLPSAPAAAAAPTGKDSANPAVATKAAPAAPAVGAAAPAAAPTSAK